MTSRIQRRSPLAIAFVTALVLAISACRGTSPERQDETPREAEASQPSALLLAIEWTDGDLEKSAERNAYGSKAEAILARSADGALVLTPQTSQDHVATAFTPLQSYDGERSLELFLDVRTAGGDACVANLQDQAFNMILAVPCRNAGEQRATVNVPKTVSSVRLYFQSASREPIRLPARVRLTEHR